MYNKIVFALITICFSPFVYAEDPTPESFVPQLPGNYKYPSSQQVFPLISFGQNIIGKVVMFELPTFATFSTQKTNETIIVPEIIWGVTDLFSILIDLPVIPENREGQYHSSGLGDGKIQLEGAPYTFGDELHQSQWTILANVTAPTGSSKKNPPNGYGSPSFFGGFTFSYMDPEWYWFFSSGATFPLPHGQKRPGIQYLYQAGLGHYIPTHPSVTLDWMVEFDGTYTWKERVHGAKDPNTGSNIILATPSLYLATLRWTAQLGVGYPILQQLNGNQPKQFLTIAASVAYTFYGSHID